MAAQQKRGFAAMNQEQQRAIASKGGRAAHKKGTAHEFSSEEARQAGYVGGKAVSANREHMAAIGRKGGQRTGRTLNVRRHAEITDRNNSELEGPATREVKDYHREEDDSLSKTKKITYKEDKI